MRIITEPTVAIISKSEFIPHPEYDIPPDGDQATQLGAFAAKSCYDSFGTSGRANETNQLALLEHRHGSVLEHIHIGLFIEGITRGLSLELNRHRTFNISQRSTRYVKEEEAAIVLDPYYSRLYEKYPDDYYPPKFNSLNSEDELHLLDDFVDQCEASIERYSHQVKQLEELNPLNLEGFDLRKWARGKARGLLPHALETRGVYTNNIRGWRWFIESRSDIHAEAEIRRLADAVVRLLKKEFPIYFQDFEIEQTYDSIPRWLPKYSKV